MSKKHKNIDRERCELCWRKFEEKELKYTVTVASFDSCGYNVKYKGEEKIIRLVGRAKYSKKLCHVCERCVVVASIEEIFGFGEELPTSNYIPDVEGEGDGESIVTHKVGARFKFHEVKNFEDEELL